LNGVQFLDEIVDTVGQSAAGCVPKHQRVIEELDIKQWHFTIRWQQLRPITAQRSV